MASTVTIIHATSSATKTPGPGAYTTPSCVGTESPRFTIKNRLHMKENKTDGSYQVLPSTIGTGNRYSFGCRHKEFERMQTPGPSYIPPPIGSDVPKLCFHSKPAQRNIETSPGPSICNDPTIRQSPRYTLKARQFPNNEGESCSPGPGKYLPDYEKVMTSARRCAFNSRHPTSDKEQTPGPYTVPYTPDLRPISFHRRINELKKDDVPGPGKYNTDRAIGSDARKNAIHLRIDKKQEVNTAPYQKIPDTIGNDGPKYSLSIRPKEREYEVSPGPNYVPPSFGSDVAKMNMHARTGIEKKDSGPGPSYVPQNGGGKKYTMKARNFIKNDGEISGPGPGKYLPSFEASMPSSPKTGIRVRTDSQRPPPKSPGYYLLPTNSGPKISIGVRDTTTILPGSN